MRTTFHLRNLNGKDHLGDLDVDRRVILKLMLKNSGVDWIYVAQDGVLLQAVVSTVMNLRVP